MASDPRLRVSVAALCRVVFPHPQTGELLLAMERRTAWINGAVRVQAQPFGGALRILDLDRFRLAIGEFDYDSPRSQHEQDLRILIPPPAWEPARDFILSQLQSDQSEVIETGPCRELEEEFVESAGIALLPAHYIYHPLRTFVQNQPQPTSSSRMPGAATVRIYQIFEVAILDAQICHTLLENSQHSTDEDLQASADADLARGGHGRANGSLVIPFDEVKKAFLNLPPSEDSQTQMVLGHRFNATSSLLLE